MKSSIGKKPKKKYQVRRRSGTIIENSTGTVQVFGPRDFMKKIVLGNCCFICGAEQDSKSFNNEHILPQWLLKLFRSHKDFMILPNNATIKYGSYLVPCCQDCNSEMSAKLEVPVSNLLKGGYDNLWNALDKDTNIYKLLFQWLCLILFKTHYKDTFLRSELDLRKASSNLGHYYDWYPLHHIYRMATLHYTDVKPSFEAYGTILVMRARPDDFDYLDNLDDQIIYIQVGDILLMAALNDSKACLSLYKTFLSRIDGALNQIQIRELFARLRYVVANLKNPPKFSVRIKRDTIALRAKRAKPPSIYKGEEEKKSLFKLMRDYLEPLMHKDLPNRRQLVEDLEQGKAQYILDGNGKFHEYS
jgi:hypothetical protein